MVRRCDITAINTATIAPATAPPSSTETCHANATAMPGKTACATASPIKAMPRSTTKQPTTAHSTAAITAAASARGRNASWGLAMSARNCTNEISGTGSLQMRSHAAQPR